MATSSAIEWTEATWNPTTGCTKISQGCKNCYAATLSRRLKAMGLAKYRDEFKFRQHEQDVELPLTWKKPKKIFVNSMSDLFHEEVEDEFVARCFDTMIRADWHVYQVLTKRPERMAAFSKTFKKRSGFPVPDHIWLGTSVEDNETVFRIRQLRKAACRVRFVSFEPLLGAIRDVDLSGIDWAIIGGESGRGYRPVEGDWIRGLIRQCKRQKVKVFFKQWGGPRPKSGGRRIDGRTYSQYPELSARPGPDAKKMRDYKAGLAGFGKRGKMLRTLEVMDHA